MAEVLASLGPILEAAGEPVSALAALTEAFHLAGRSGPRWVVAASLEAIATVAAGQPAGAYRRRAWPARPRRCG